MPLPNSKVLIALLAEYKTIRGDKWVAPVESTISHLAKSLFRLDIPGDRVSECQRLEHRFGEAKTVQDWVRAVDEIGRAIKEAEETLYWSTASLFAETLHAIRSYIVALLRYEPKDDASRSTRREFEQCVETIKDDLQRQKVAIVQERHRGIDTARVDELIKEKNLTLIKLAFLGDETSIYEAVDLNLFPRDRYEYPDRDSRRRIEQLHSLNPDSVNVNKPLYLQDKYYYIFYAKNFFQKTNLSFKEFIQKAAMEDHPVSTVDIEDIIFESENSRPLPVAREHAPREAIQEEVSVVADNNASPSAQRLFAPPPTEQPASSATSVLRRSM